MVGLLNLARPVNDGVLLMCSRLQARSPRSARIIGDLSRSGVAMRYQTMWRQAAAPGGRTGIVAILLSAVMLSPVPLARATEQPSAAVETPAPTSGPLTPVKRDAPTAAERPTAKPPASAKVPTEMAPATAAGTATPSPNKPEAFA